MICDIIQKTACLHNMIWGLRHMKRITSKLKRILVATLLFAATATISAMPSAAQADCSGWDLSGDWAFVQTNGTSPTFTLHQTGTGLQGSAIYWYEYRNSGFRLPIKASVDGMINGDSVEITAYWDNRTIGVYTAKIGPLGRLEGTTYDRQNPETIASWYSDRTAKCPGRSCSRWDLNGQWKFNQTNGVSPTFTLQQTETGLKGSAIYNPAAGVNCFTPGCDELFNVRASVD